MKLLAIGFKTDVDLAGCSRNPYEDKNFTAYNISLYSMHPEEEIVATALRDQKTNRRYRTVQRPSDTIYLLFNLCSTASVPSSGL